MLTQQPSTETSIEKRESGIAPGGSETLADAVTHAVESYFREMGDQPITELYELVLSEIEAPLLRAVLKHTNNNQSLSAAVLGLNRGTLRKKLKKYGML